MLCRMLDFFLKLFLLLVPHCLIERSFPVFLFLKGFNLPHSTFCHLCLYLLFYWIHLKSGEIEKAMVHLQAHFPSPYSSHAGSSIVKTLPKIAQVSLLLQVYRFILHPPLLRCAHNNIVSYIISFNLVRVFVVIFPLTSDFTFIYVFVIHSSLCCSAQLFANPSVICYCSFLLNVQYCKVLYLLLIFTKAKQGQL